LPTILLPSATPRINFGGPPRTLGGVSVQCPSCATENSADARFCSNCGTELTAVCTRCGSRIAAGARFCSVCGQPVENEAAPEERKLATAVFVDLAESTALGEQLDPERVRSILQDYFSLVSSIVQAWGGTVEKFIGDAVVAVFGVPRVREDDAVRAVSAAAEITERFAELAVELERKFGVRLAIRVGVNSGEVLAPSEVHPDRPMVTGDAINVAARLQSEATPGSVLVGERTYQSTGSLFRFAEPVDLRLKGVAEPVRAYPLVGRIEGAVEAGPARNLQARLFGRERELAILGGLLDEAIESEMPRLAVAYGPAGIGKSRLIREVVGLGSSERPDLMVLRGRCPAIGQSMTYWPLAEIVRSACGIALDDTGTSGQEKLWSRAREVLEGSAEADIEAIVDVLATTAGIALPDNPLDRSRPLAVVTELARRWPQFLSALASRQPQIVIIEDLHWASPQVVEMIERLLARSSGPILLLATARPEFAAANPSFALGSTEATTISLRPLNRNQSGDLLAGLLPANDLSAAIQDQILATAEGNPLFVEEIVTRLIEAGTLEKQRGRWRSTGRSADVAIPDTINGLLGARIDALPDAERRVLREAAVVGRIFWEQPVAVAVGATEVAAPMAELERRGLVVMRPTSSLAGQVEYGFKHALIRDVAYGGLSIARRARAHADAARWLTGLSPDRPEELAEMVAFHYKSALEDGADLAWPADSGEFAVVRARAREAFIVAGATARKRYSTDRAIELHQLALELSTTDEERAVAFEALGDDHDAAYDGDHALPAWDGAIALRRTMPGSGAHVARLAMKAARVGAIRWGGFTVARDPAVLDAYVDAGLEGASAGEHRAWLLALRAAVGLRWVAFHRSDPMALEDRVRAGEEGLAYARETDDHALEANALRAIGALLLAYGEVERGLALTRQLLDEVHLVEDARERHLATIEGAQTLMWTGGEAERMVPTLEDAIKLGRELRVHDLCHSTATLMSALYLAGRWDEIPIYLEEHVRVFATDSAGTTCPFALGAFQLGATVLAQRGELDRARDVAALMPRSESPIGIVEGLAAMAANALGDPATARAIAERALSSGGRNFAEEPPVELAAYLDALIALGDWDRLREFLPEARSRSAELALAGPTTDRAEGLAASAAGDEERARERLAQAIAGFDRVSAFEAARTREALAAIDEGARKALLTAALATYGRLGARPYAERVSAQLAR
jgi:class 3 adenylate cyclase